MITRFFVAVRKTVVGLRSTGVPVGVGLALLRPNRESNRPMMDLLGLRVDFIHWVRFDGWTALASGGALSTGLASFIGALLWMGFRALFSGCALRAGLLACGALTLGCASAVGLLSRVGTLLDHSSRWITSFSGCALRARLTVCLGR